jgi:hypothetical protein
MRADETEPMIVYDHKNRLSGLLRRAWDSFRPAFTPGLGRYLEHLSRDRDRPGRRRNCPGDLRECR